MATLALLSLFSVNPSGASSGAACEIDGVRGNSLSFSNIAESLDEARWPPALAGILDELTASRQIAFADVRLLAEPEQGLREIGRNNYTAYVLENEDGQGMVWGNAEKLRGHWQAHGQPVSLVGAGNGEDLCVVSKPMPQTHMPANWSIGEDAGPAPTAAASGTPVSLPPDADDLTEEAACVLSAGRSSCSGNWEPCGPDPADGALFICAVGDVDFCDDLTIEVAFDKMADNAFQSYATYNLQGQAGMSVAWLVCWVNGDYYDHSKTSPEDAAADFEANNPFGVVEPGVLHLFSSYVDEVFGYAFCAAEHGVGGYPINAVNSQLEYELLLHETGHNYNAGHESGTVCGYNGAAVLDTGDYSIMHTSGFGGSKDMTFTDGANNGASRNNLNRIEADWSNRGVLQFL